MLRHSFAITLLAFAHLTCSGGGGGSDPATENDPIPRGKADSFKSGRNYEVILTNPHCDVCTTADKDHLVARSRIVERVVEIIDGAEKSIEVAQFTFSRQPIEDALRRAHDRGVRVRIAMNAAQADGDNPSTRLRDAGLDVKFVKGKDAGSFAGLQHAKFMIADDETVVLGSNNWSSTGVSINDENTIVVETSSDDPFLGAFECYFEFMFTQNITLAPTCASEETRFTPSGDAWRLIRDEIRAAQVSIDVLMHHLVFDDAVEELAKAAERGVRVRIVVNEADRAEIRGSDFERLQAAGGQVRFKRTNGDLFQIMHDKLAIFDGKVLVNGSGNWSGSAFFNNWEFYVRYDAPQVVDPFEELFSRLWSWSLSAQSLDAGLTPREQDVAARQVYFGNLHAHIEWFDGERMLDDGKLERGPEGMRSDVSAEAAGNPARHAWQYARDQGGMDFLALSPHVQDDDPADAPNIANMTPEKYQELIATAQVFNQESAGTFVALPSFEWSTNSTGNHVNVLGSNDIAKVLRGDFRTFYEGFLAVRREEGDPAYLMFNHPRTFRHFEEALNGNWDQIFGVNLAELPKAGERDDKFNDFGLDDFPPLSEVRQSWIDGTAMPDEAIVAQTLSNIADVTAPHARLFEVTVGRGTEFGAEEPQNPSLTADPETGEIGRFIKAHSDWDYYLRNGFRFAPVANHDNHLANWGTGHTSRTAIIAAKLDEISLLEAIGERAVYASEDQNLEVRFYAQDRVRSGGELVTISSSVSLQLFLNDPDFTGPYEVTVWGGTVGGSEVAALQNLGELTGGEWHRFDVDTSTPGVHFFYVEVLERTPDRMAWSAPIWVERQ